MRRDEYNACIRPYITGSKPKEQRRLDFCIGAKICSGKAKDEEEARRICIQSPEPKAPNPRRARSKAKSCEKQALEISQCMVDYFERNNLYRQITNINSVEIAMANALMECLCQK